MSPVVLEAGDEVAAVLALLADAEVLADNHTDRPVVRASTAAGPVVVKCYADLVLARDTWCLSQQLWQSAFGEPRSPGGLPRPIALVDLPGTATQAARAAFVMEALDGEPIGARGDLGRSIEPAVEMETARLLADLHRSAVEAPRRRSVSGVVRSLSRKADDDGGRSPSFAATVAEVAALAPAAADRPLVVCHGDFSPRNVLATPAGLRLIDVDRARTSDPARDVAYWGAWAWATLLLRGDEPTWEVGDRFAVAYRHAGGVSTTPVAVAFHRAAALVRIAHGWSALQARPDLREAVLAEARRIVGTAPAA